MRIMDVTPENIDTEHICCAISEKRGESCVSDKKAWLRGRFAEGLSFKKLDVRGKVFIEYMPAEHAWYPIDAPGCMHIDCLWVSGQYKQQGHANALLEACVADARAQGKKGITVISASPKHPFLSDPKFLTHKGFQKVDDAAPYFELWYLPLEEDAKAPSFRSTARTGRIEEQGMVLYYTDQCTYSNTYARRIQAIAEERGLSLTLHRLKSYEEAQAAPTAWPTYSFFDYGEFVTHVVHSESTFLAYLSTRA